jgi:RND family efflux transporter MFP subunit
MKKIFTTALILLVVIALAAGVVLIRKQRMGKVAELPGMGETPWALHTVDVKRGRLSRGFPVLATLSGSTEITVSSQISGQIEAMGPREGVKVGKGEVLAQISVADLQKQREGLIDQHEAAVAERERTSNEYARYQQLMEKGLTSRELVEDKQVAAIAAGKQAANLDKQIATLDVRIGYGTVRAPRDALVAARLMEVGDVAQPGKPLYRLTVDSAARLRVNLPQQVLEQVGPGSEVVLTHGSQRETVRLTRIFPQLDARALGAAETDLDTMPFGLPSGARIPARVLLETADQALTVPHAAVVRTGNRGFLFKVTGEGDRQTLKRVTVDITLDGRDGLAVSGDLQAGDRVVIGHQSVLMQLRDGDPVMTGAPVAGGSRAGARS